MAGGPLKSRPVIENSDRAWAGVYIGGGANAHRHEVVTAEASMSANTTVRYRFEVPPTLPTGTAKLRVIAMSNNASEVAKFDVQWASVAVEEDASAATLNAEGTQTITWATSDEDVFKEVKVTLDADSGGVKASEFIVMQFIFETTSWTLSTESGWIISVIWE